VPVIFPKLPPDPKCVVTNGAVLPGMWGCYPNEFSFVSADSTQDKHSSIALLPTKFNGKMAELEVRQVLGK
jgi:hypothetical protein